MRGTGVAIWRAVGLVLVKNLRAAVTELERPRTGQLLPKRTVFAVVIGTLIVAGGRPYGRLAARGAESRGDSRERCVIS